jgi:nucleoside diphosphate kinase
MKVDWLERTLCLVKPDAVRRGLVGQILARFEMAGFKIVGMKLVQSDQKHAEQHYLYDDIAVRHGEKVWKNLIHFLVSGPVLAFVLEGFRLLRRCVKSAGALNRPPPHLEPSGETFAINPTMLPPVPAAVSGMSFTPVRTPRTHPGRSVFGLIPRSCWSIDGMIRASTSSTRSNPFVSNNPSV